MIKTERFGTPKPSVRRFESPESFTDSCSESQIPIRGLWYRFADCGTDSRIVVQIRGMWYRFADCGTDSRIVVRIRGLWYRFADCGTDSRIAVQIRGLEIIVSQVA